MNILIQRLIREEDGQDLIEYALIAALIAVLLVASLTALRGGIEAAFTSVVDALT